MQRWGIRVTCAKYHIPEVQEVISRNRRVGTSISGCLQSPLFNPETLDRVYGALREEAKWYAEELGIPEPIRNTTIKPSGTKSKMDDVDGEGIHCGFSRYMIQRIRFAADDRLLPLLREAGHYMEPVQKFDGTLDHGTMVVDFYKHTDPALPCVDEGFDTWKQLEALKIAQKHWSDQSVSVTVYYRRDEIEKIKEWLQENYKDLKTISFLCHSEHGFKQAPKEAITQEQYERAVAKLKPIDIDGVMEGDLVGGLECAGGACPIR
jgi:ribonucleoside-triphosphate reductase